MIGGGDIIEGGGGNVVGGGEGLERGHVIGGWDIIGGGEGNVVGGGGEYVVGEGESILWGRGRGGRGHDSGRVQSSRGDGSSGAPTSVRSIILLTVACFLSLAKLIAMLRHVVVLYQQLFFGLELPDTIAYKRTEAFVDFNFTFLFIH